MPHATDVALSHLRKLLSRDPMLRDVLAEALPGVGRGAGFVPDVDVLEGHGRTVVLVDLPGVQRADVRVRLEGARLVIEGERHPHGIAGVSSRSGERPVGPFRREFLLPTDVEADAVRASLDDGVLRVDVPRRGHDADRDVPIDVEVGARDGNAPETP